jgi:hypothetical protein
LGSRIGYRCPEEDDQGQPQECLNEMIFHWS